jgi:hypothetical protein
VAFSPDGETLLVGCDDGGARLWDARTSIPLGPPLCQGHPILAVSFTADGQTVLTTAADGSTWSWPVPEPCTGDEESLALALEVRTGLALDATSQAPAPLDHVAWGERRRRLEGREGTAEDALGPPIADGLWHDARAREAEQSGALFAAGWHLDRLAGLRPADWLVFARRGRLRVAEGRMEGAAADYRLAERLGPGDALEAWCREEETAWRLGGRTATADWYAARPGRGRERRRE